MSKAGFSIKPRLYVPKCRKHETDPPQFTIRRLNPLELQDISEKYADADETIELGGIEEPKDQADEKKDKTVKVKVSMLNRLARSRYDVLNMALSGWEKVEDEDGQPIPFSKEAIACLDGDIVNELSEVAQGGISAEEVKNSESPSA